MINRFNEIEVKNIINDYLINFKSMKEIGLKYNATKITIRKILTKNNIEIYKRSEPHNKIIFNEEQIKFICYNYENKFMTINELSNKYSCTSGCISRILKENNINTSNFIYLKQEEINEIINLYNIYHTYNAVSKNFKYKGKNLSESFIIKILNENNIIKIERKTNILTDEQIKELINLYCDESKFLYTKDLAEKYNIKYELVNNILDKNNIPRKKRLEPTKLKAEQNKDYIITEYLKTKKVAPIARELKINHAIINKLLVENNIIITRDINKTDNKELKIRYIDENPIFTDYQKDFIINHYKNNYNIIDICKILDIQNRIHIYNLLKNNGIKCLYPGKRIFTNEEIENICYEYLNGIKTVKELCKEYDVSQKYMGDYIKNQGYEIKKRTTTYNKIELSQEDIINLIEQYQNTTTPIEVISNIFNISSIVLYRILKENNIPIINRKIKIFTDSEIKDIIDLYKNNNSTITIAKLYNISPSKINNLLVENNIEIKDSRHIIFLDEDIKYIIDNYINRNKSVKELSIDYNCSTDTIYRILNENSVEIKDKNIIDFTVDEIKYICNSYTNKTKFVVELKDEFAVSSFSIYKILYDNNIEIHDTYNTSTGERLLRNILKKYLNNVPDKGDRILLGTGHEIDILLNDYKIGIEYNGVYYHSTDKKGKNYHINKTNLTTQKDYHLIQVFEDEFQNNTFIVINKILKLIGSGNYINYDDLLYLKENILNHEYIEIIKRDVININSNNYYTLKIQSDIKQNQFYIGYGVVKYFDETNNINYGIFTKENNIQIGYYSINGDNVIENFYIEEKYNFKNFDINIFNNYIEKHKPTNLIIKFDKRWFSKKHLKDFENIGFILDSEEEPRISYYKNDKRFHEYDNSYSENIIHDCGAFVYKLEI
jgi:hypothetical protein